MNTNSNAYVLTFAVGICVVMSTALAFLATSLKPTQEKAAEFDRQKNVMMAAGLIERGDPRQRAELEKLFETRVDDLDEMCEKLRAAGIEVIRKPEWDMPGVGRFARIHDPEGNAIELWEPEASRQG